MLAGNLARQEMTPDQLELWARVEEVWRLSTKKDGEGVRSVLHPRFSSWESGSPIPQDRDLTIASATRHALSVTHYQLHPMRIETFDGHVGVVHYYFRALLEDAAGESRGASGRWTEVYVRKGESWLMIASHGGAADR